MKSYLLKSYLPEISGNLKITVDDNDVKLSVNITDLALADSKLLNRTIDLENDYSNDLFNMLSLVSGKNIVKSELESKRRIKKPTGYHLAPIWLMEEVPDTLILVKGMVGETDVRKKSIIKVYDLSGNSKIGKYIRKHHSSIKNFNPIEVNVEEKVFYVNGINVNKGIIMNHKMKFDNFKDINKKIVDFIRNKNIILPNILNLEFKTYYDLKQGEEISAYYCNNIELLEYTPKSIKSKDFLPLSFDLFLEKNEMRPDVSNSKGNIISFDSNNIPFIYTKYNDKILETNYSDGVLNIPERINLEMLFEKDVDFERFTPKFYYQRFKYKGGIELNDYVGVSTQSFSIDLIADHLPNMANFGNEFLAGQNIQHIFNWIGTKEDVLDAISKAWNDTSFEKTIIKCNRVDDSLVFYSLYGSPFEIKLSHGSFEKQDGYDYFLSEYSTFRYKSEQDFSHSGDKFMQDLSGNYRIIGTSKIVDEIFKDDYGKYHLKYSNYKLAIVDYSNKSETMEGLFYVNNPKVGLFDVFDVNEIDKTIFVGEGENEDDYYSILKPKMLAVGNTYRVMSKNTIIKHSNQTYTYQQDFVATTYDYQIISGEGFVCLSYFADDSEIKKMASNGVKKFDIKTNNEIIFEQQNQTDVFDKNVDLIRNSFPDYKSKINQQNKKNLEWFIPSKKPYTVHSWNLKNYGEKIYDIFEARDFGKGYLETVVKSNKTKFFISNNKAKTIFKGFEIILEKDYEGFEFCAILNVRNNESYKKGLQARIIENIDDKSIILCLDVSIFDYKFSLGNEENFYYFLLYYLNDYKSWSNFSGFNYQFSLPSSLIVSQPTFNGIFLPIESSNVVSNDIMFDVRNSIRIFANEDEGDFYFIAQDDISKTIVSNYGYLDSNGMINNLPKKKAIIKDNSITTNDGKLYVTTINGVIYQQELSINSISNYLDWRNIKWYKHNGGRNSFIEISKYLNFSFIKESINLGKSFFERIKIQDNKITNSSLNLKISDSNSFYSGFYTLKVKNIEDYSGSTLPNTWSININKFDENSNSWISDDTGINILEEIYNKEIKININE